MKILFITQLLPYPAHSGGKVKSLAILQTLAQKHNLHLACFHDKKSDGAFAHKLAKKHGISVKSFHWPVVTSQYKKIKVKAFLSVFSHKPFVIYKYFHPLMACYLHQLSNQVKFDVIYLDHNTSFQYLPYIKKQSATKIIFDEHNIDSIAYLRKSKSYHHNFLMAMFTFYDAFKHYFYEKKILAGVDFSFCISQNDRELLIKRGALRSKTAVLPVPFVSKSLFSHRETHPTIMIPGMMSWPPNKNGIIWFCKQVYPLIKKEVPNVKLYIVGPNPDRDLHQLSNNDKSIIVTGEVKSLTPYYIKCSLVAVPILMGSGIRIKILHALAAGIPVVSTKIGAEGIVERSGHGIVVTDSDPEDFARKVRAVINKKQLANQLSEQGIKFIKSNYSEKKVSLVLDNYLSSKRATCLPPPST